MKFAIEGTQRHYFRQHHALEVQNLLKESQLKELNLQLDKTMEIRLKTGPVKTTPLPNEIFSSSRDLSRSNAYLKKIILNTQFAEIASDLVEYRPLRFGFDQLYTTITPSLQEKPDLNPYKNLMLQPRSLKEITCIQGILCGLMICLSGNQEIIEEQTASIFSKTPGNAVFFSPEAVFDFNDLVSSETHRYLMIVYTHPTAIYYFEENDPETHHFKSLGYVFGDRLGDKNNPIIFR